MGLDVHALKRKARLGDKRAARIYPLRLKGNHLLTTLLLGNVAVNAILAIFLGSLISGVAASVLATALIFLFGEIFPQAIISRFAMTFGYYSTPAVLLLMRLSALITYPIAWALDKLLGEELPEIYTKHEIMELISEHEDSAESAIDQDEERIIHGALKFSHKTARDVMTPWSNVIWFYHDQTIDRGFKKKLEHEAYSRYPIISRGSGRVIGILFVKEVLFSPEVTRTEDLCEREVLVVRDTRPLDNILQRMLKRHRHMAIVQNEVGTLVGVITLEDILEEVLQQEILDEDDEDEVLPPTPSASSVL
jgi:metal transporter CNNM